MGDQQRELSNSAHARAELSRKKDSFPGKDSVHGKPWTLCTVALPTSFFSPLRRSLCLSAQVLGFGRVAGQPPSAILSLSTINSALLERYLVVYLLQINSTWEVSHFVWKFTVKAYDRNSVCHHQFKIIRLYYTSLESLTDSQLHGFLLRKLLELLRMSFRWVCI